MLNIGPPELILIFVIALVIVGPQRLPELGRTIGKGLRELRKMQDEVKDLVNTGMGDDFKQAATELKQTAADLKSATDVRSAFQSDEPRTRPRGASRPGTRTGPAPVPASDAGSAHPPPPVTDPGTGLEAPAGQDGHSGPPAASPENSPVDTPDDASAE